MSTNKPINTNLNKLLSSLLGVFFLISWVIGEFPKLAWPWQVTPLDAAVGLMAIAGWIRGVRGMRRIWGISLILLVSWGLGLRLFSLKESIPGGLYLLRFIGYLWIIVHAERLLAPVKKFITPALWIFVMLGLLQYVMIPDTRFLLRYGWDEHYYRLIGAVLDPNYAGAMLGVIALFALDRFLARRGVSMALLVAGSTIGLTLTFSRASWLASGVAFAYYFCSLRHCEEFLESERSRSRRSSTWQSGMRLPRSSVRRTSLAMTLTILLLVFVIAPKPGGEGVNIFRTNSILQRTESWRQALTIWRSYPIIGVGFNNYSIASQQLNFQIDPKSHATNAPDSSWLLLLATTGIFGIVLLGSLTTSQLKMYYNRSGRTQYNTFYSSLVVLLTVHSLFTNTLFFPPMLGLIALTLLRPSAYSGLRPCVAKGFAGGTKGSAP